jgi:hypothetical protein
MTQNVIGMFCEDIREEKSGQVSIIGILPDSIRLPPPPQAIKRQDGELSAVIPKLGLYIRLLMPIGPLKGPMPIRLDLPDGRNLPLGEIDDALIEKSLTEARANNLPIAGVIFHALMQGFQIARPGLIRAILTHQDEEQVCAVLNVIMPTST